MVKALVSSLRSASRFTGVCGQPRSYGPVRALFLLLSAAVLVAAGCDSVERANPAAQASRATGLRGPDIPPIMRGTVAQDTIMVGYRPVIVRGYGLVVGLRGTGSSTMPAEIRAHFRQEMARRGIGGRDASGMPTLQPDDLLNSPDTAVVIVEGIIPPGAVGKRTRRGLHLEGTKLDLRVYADPRTDTISLEGGRLYTCELRPVLPGEILPPIGSQQAASLVEARGPIFINPFAISNNDEPGTIDLAVGRILAGGEVLNDIPLKLRLLNPSHARAELLQSAINTRFPQERGQTEPTARGESDESIRITVPMSWRDRPEEFIRLLQSTSLRQARAEEIARSVGRQLQQDPIYALDASWRWHALGIRALPIIREFYDSPDDLPRMAALRSGARLDDAMVIPHLIEMSASRSIDLRREAIELLANVRPNLRVDIALRERLNDEEVDVRLAAYESMVERGDPTIRRMDVGGKFLLDVVDSNFPMVYITQVGEPKIVIMGSETELLQPVFIDLWAGRFMAQTISGDGRIEVFFRQRNGSRVVHQSSAKLTDLARLMGHRSTLEQPDPGLDLTYVETVGLLYQFVRRDFVRADFKAQQDRVLAAINRQREDRSLDERPDFIDLDPDADSGSEPAEWPDDAPPTDAPQLLPPPPISSQR